MIQLVWQIPAQFLFALIITFVASRLVLTSWRQSASAHWTERARLLWPVRVSATSNVILVPVVLGLLQQILFPGISRWWLLNGLAALCGSLLGSLPLDREMFPGLGLRDWLHQTAVSWSLRLGVWMVFIAGVAIMPEEFGWLTAAVAVPVFLLHIWAQFGLLLKPLRWMKLLNPAPERLHRIVAETSVRMNVPAPRVWTLRGPMATAFAFVSTRELLFSDRLLEISDDAEVAAICAHELAHLTESKAVLVGRIASSLALFPFIFLKPLFHSMGFLAFVIPGAAFFIIIKLANRLSTRMEVRADQMAKANQLDEGVYARALEKIYRENQLPAVNANSRQTHPHLYDRLLAAGITPDYPRPGAPDKQAWTGMIIAGSLGALIGILLVARNREHRAPNYESDSANPVLQNPNPPPIHLQSS